MDITKNETISTYIKHREDDVARRAEYTKRKQTAQSRLDELKAEYEHTMRQAILSGKDAGTKLDKLSDDITDAERVLARIIREEQTFSRLNMAAATAPVNKNDVINAFNTEIVADYHKKTVDPMLAELLAAKRAYAEAVVKYGQVHAEAEDMRNHAREIIGATRHTDQGYYKFKDPMPQGRAHVERYFITETDLHHMANFQMPPSVPAE